MAILLSALILLGAKPPVVGDKAPAFDVQTLDRKSVRLASLLKQGPVVLVVLRGYPGYQCPLCTRQVGELFAKSGEFAKRRTSVVMVYPGPSAELETHADEFVGGKEIPKGFHFTVDPDYRFTQSYGLRWNAAHETAYPSTFVVGRDGRVAYAKVSRSHGDRAPIGEVLASLDGLPKRVGLFSASAVHDSRGQGGVDRDRT